MTPALRLLQPTDAEALAALLPDLGYQATADQIRRRLAAMREGAHAFYEHLGFEKSKASYAFELRRPSSLAST